VLWLSKLVEFALPPKPIKNADWGTNDTDDDLSARTDVPNEQEIKPTKQTNNFFISKSLDKK